MKSQNLDEQTSFFHYNNKNLFSNYYLDNYVKRYPEWKEDEKIKSIFEKVKQIYSRNKSLLTKYNEAQLEKHYIQPIMKVLGHYFEIQEATYRIPKRPDHAFFVNEDNRKEALKNKGKEDFYKRVISVGDAKAWDVPLDRKFRGKKAYTSENPSLQIDIYLRETPPEWGILTNGKLWRIYYEKTSHKLDSFYEVDLQNTILKNDLEGFKYFYLFFRREAFTPDTTGKTFLDHVYNQSIEYARELGEELKENIYQALKLMAQGFLDWKKNNLKTNPETLETIRQNSLIFLYRLLFIFYAESRELLPKEHHYSLDSIKKEIAEKEMKGERVPSYTSDYWIRLKEFFDLVNEGSESRGIPKEELYIPAYNGGLFDPNQHKFLEDNCVSDYFCAKVIDLLARASKNEDGSAFIDYSTLAIRHLGSIYEGLLENRLKIAEQDLVAIKEKRSEFWVPVSETKCSNQIIKGDKVVYKNKNYKIADTAFKDSVYLVTDRGERKSTGSYYTPDYIVEYIVKNTLSPLVEEKRKSKDDLVNEILDIKVLDPAMGSGHFLVEATDFLARALVEALAEEEKEFEEDEIRIARREVVERCIFGIDLNPLAVELAKLSLWLSTVSIDNALSFLDHHLKCGNSLIGAKIEELSKLPELRKSRSKKKRPMGIFEPQFMKRVGDFLDVFEKIETLSSDTAEQVKEKSRIFNDEFEKKSIPFKTIADLWISNFFGNEVPFSEYSELQMSVSDLESEPLKKYPEKKWFRKAIQIAEKKHIFHWELEFPEIFFEKGKRKNNPGFDAVVGNPPYIRVDNLDIEEKSFWKAYFETPSGKYDIYYLFMENNYINLKEGGRFGFITPNRFCSNFSGESLRKKILKNSNQINISSVSRLNVFEEASIYPVITISEKKSQSKHKELITYKFNNKNDIVSCPPSYILDETKLKVLPKFIIPLNTGEKELFLVLDILRKNQDLKVKDILDISEGLRIPQKYENNTKKLKDDLHIIKQYQFTRYSGLKEGSYISKKNLKKVLSPKSNRFINMKKQKIIFAEDALRIEATLENENGFCQGGVYFGTLKNNDHELNTLLSLFNSKLYTFIYMTLFSGIHMGGGYLRFRSQFLYELPLPIIQLNKNKNQRKDYLDALTKNYMQLLFKNNQEPIKHLSGFLLDSEKYDILYYFLSYLANEIINLIKKKNLEIKNFLAWLEREIKCKIIELKNFKKIFNYFDETFEKLIDIIKENKEKIEINPSRKDFQELIKDEFDSSIKNIKTLEEKITITDWLIDQIVYKLYGLSDDEIKLVEESIPK